MAIGEKGTTNTAASVIYWHWLLERYQTNLKAGGHNQRRHILESINKNYIIRLAEIKCDMSECGFKDYFLHCVE